MAGILSDTAILAALESGDIEIDPFVPEHVNITSYDLTLGTQVKVYEDWVTVDTHAEKAFPDCTKDGGSLKVRDFSGGSYYNPSRLAHDIKKPLKTLDFNIDPDLGWVLNPGIGYLLHTRERVCSKKYNPILDGKSSIARLFIQVHFTAGFGDPGYSGPYTLEVSVLHPVRVYPGMRFCQIRFHTIAGELSKTYDQVGHYTGVHAQGAVASQAWRQFKP
jgi:deoxycytidine triphosphate deaminase